MHIREARQEDAKAISKLMGELGYESTAADIGGRLQSLSTDRDAVLVAELGDVVVGFISFHALPLFHARGNQGRITAMCVSQDHRRQGIGQQLLYEIHRIAVRMECRRVEVTSGDRRKDEAHQFYTSCGYIPSDQRFLINLNHQG